MLGLVFGRKRRHGSFDHDDGARGRCGVPGQLAKARPPMLTGPAGSMISVKDVHPLKAYCPISVRLGGSVISI